MLADNDEIKTMQVYFLISGLVIDAATQGKTQPGPDVFLFTCTSDAIYAGDQELFMSTRVEDTILALDAPFKLTSPVATKVPTWMLMMAFGQCMALSMRLMMTKAL